jgi:hypothetical protein
MSLSPAKAATIVCQPEATREQRATEHRYWRTGPAAAGSRWPHARDDRAKKTWFFDQILAKYGQSDWTFSPGYPLLDRIMLYEQEIEVMTGQRSEGLHH